jgi:hypothetical protein
VIADELAFWPNESSTDPAEEILAAVRPGLSTTNGLLLGVSSPHVQHGPLYTAYRNY